MLWTLWIFKIQAFKQTLLSLELSFEEQDSSDGFRTSVSKKRTRITTFQKCELEKKFMESVYISKHEQEQLSQKLNLSTKTIQVSITYLNNFKCLIKCDK